MAGTPTTNYNIPTYADTDAPDLSGAYNDAMGIIDTQLKANADAIENSSTGNYTGTSPIVVDNGQRTISVSKARSAQTSEGSVTNYGDKGTLSFAGSADIIATVASMPGNDKDTVVPNCFALTQYVESKMAAAGAAYTGTAPIVVDNGSHAISVTPAGDYTWNDNKVTSIGPLGVVRRVNLPAPSIAKRIDAQVDNYWATGDPSIAVPTVATLKAYVDLHTPNASTSAKGLVRLTTSPDSADSTMAVTGSGVVRLLGDRKTNATTNVTVDMLKNLYVDTATGVVYYKAPTE